jgi:hypothetical protein
MARFVVIRRIVLGVGGSDQTFSWRYKWGRVGEVWAGRGFGVSGRIGDELAEQR